MPGDYVAVLTDGSNYFVTDILVRSDPNSANLIESDVAISYLWDVRLKLKLLKNLTWLVQGFYALLKIPFLCISLELRRIRQTVNLKP